MKSLIAVAVLAAASSGALADTYNFSSCSNSIAQSATAGNTQLRMDVTGAAGNRAEFKFYWVGTVPMSICDIYFDDAGTSGPGVLGTFGNSDLTQSSGVDFSQGATPANLPSGGTFLTSTGMSTDSNAGPGGITAHGVNTSSEYLIISIPILSGKVFADVIAALNNGFVDANNRGLRVGLHVQAIGTGYAGAGGSESFINTPNENEPQVIVPLPGAAWMGMASLAGLGAFGWKRRQAMR
jgi:hypothetical protein